MQSLLAKIALLLDGQWGLVRARIAAADWSLPPWGPALLIGGSIAALALAAICYTRTTEGLTRRNRITLALLRTVAFFALLVMVSGLVLSVKLVRTGHRDLLVVLDDSPSMRLADGKTTRLAAAEQALETGLREKLGRTHRVRVARTSEGGEPGRSGATNQPQQLAQSVIRLASRSPDRPLEAILLISDGVQIGNDPLAAAAAELAAPVFTLTAGQTNGLRDALVESVSVPPFAYRQDRAVAAVKIRSTGLSGDATLRLFQVRSGGEKEIATTSVALKPADASATARLEFVADTAGIQSYVVRLDAQPGEWTDKNNAIRFHVDVRDERIRVLFVEGEPSWEYRYAKEALESDPAVEFCGLVRLPNTEWFYQGPAKRPDGKPVLRASKDGFPIPADEMSYFDVLILGDLERKAYERGDGFGLIESFVQSRGSGLLTLGGFEVYGAGDFEGTRLARLLPFDVKGEKKKQLLNRFQVKVTSEGLMHPVLQLEFDPVKNEQAWANLPWVEGGNAIRAVKPGATCLLVHPTLRTPSGPRPVLAAWQSGRGRVVSFALDGTWHWRLAGKTDTDYHQRFWALAVRWLAGDIRERQPLGVLTSDEPVLEVGREAHFGVVLRDPDGSPLLDAEVDFALESRAGPLVTRASQDPAVPGRYAIAFTPEQAGDLTVRASVKTADGQTHEHSRTFPVGESRAEYLRVAPDPAALAELAQATGGASAMLSDWPSLRLPVAADTAETQQATLDVWQAPGLLIVLILCLSVEWFMRKRRGLA